MASYVVMQPPETARAGERSLPVFVRDGFSWRAFFFAPLWLAWHRLWLPAIATIAAMVLAIGLGVRFGFGGSAAIVIVLIALWVALEAGALRVAGLRRRGFEEIGVTEAAGLDDAELRYATQLSEDGSRRPSVATPAIRVPLTKPTPAEPGVRLIYPEQH